MLLYCCVLSLKTIRKNISIYLYIAILYVLIYLLKFINKKTIGGVEVVISELSITETLYLFLIFLSFIILQCMYVLGFGFYDGGEGNQ